LETADLKCSIEKLHHYIEFERYAGWDPFDGLSSPIFQLPVLQSSKLLRFGYQQVHRRLPFNIRPILAIKKEINPVTLGLCIQGYSYLSDFSPEKQEVYRTKIDWCLERLTELQSNGFSGACWGYNFDWEARYVNIPAFSPTIVATGFITNALFECHKFTGHALAADLCKSAAKFITQDINKTIIGDTFCYSYSPSDHQVIYNATMKGARLLAQVYSLTGDGLYIEEAKKTVNFVINNQNEDGSWSYSSGDPRSWVDNFHTAYVLDCLHEYINISQDYSIKSNLEKGLKYYLDNFFTDNAIPKYYHNKIYPIDTTAIAQSLLTLSRFDEDDLANCVANWAILNMQSKRGNFYYQKYRYYSIKIPYMRWSNAWMFVALSSILRNGKNGSI